MAELRFKSGLDRRAKIVTWSVVCVVAAAVVLFRIVSQGQYLPVWFAGIALAVIALAVLSMPRGVRLTSEAVEIRCVLEITHIAYNHIRSVRRIEPSQMRDLWPVFASIGFGGYFGYWLDVRGWDFVKIYARSRTGLVMIEDIYEQRYVVSVDQPDLLCSEVDLRKGKLPIF